MKIENCLPPKIREWCFENHVRVKVGILEDKETWATYSVDSDEIILNLNIDLPAVKKSLQHRLGLNLDDEEVWTAILLHEIGHFRMRRELNALEKIQGANDIETLSKLRVFRSEMESQAWDYCIREFWDWRFSARDDYRKWKALLK